MTDSLVEKYFKNIIKGIEGACKRQRLHHAYILVGPEGSGKFFLATYLALMLIKTKNIQHPDVLTLNCGDPGSDTKAIRNFVVNFQTTPIQADLRIGILRSLHQLEAAAQNSLLKCLEEPPKNHVLIATATSIQFLLPTIKSRAVVIQLPRLKQKDAFTSLTYDKNTKELLSHFYCGQVDWISHVQKNDIDEMTKIHSNLSSLRPENYLSFINTTLISISDLSQFKKKLAFWILHIHNSLRQTASPAERLNWTYFLEACISAYQTNSISSSRLILERVCT